MNEIKITLQPLGSELTIQKGASLQDVLFTHGVEFPCGGRGRCKGCRVRLLEGTLPVTAEESRILKADELKAGWRLACQSRPEAPVTLELAQWETTILTDDSVFDFQPRPGLGVAIDLGTTTLVAQLLDLRTGRVLAVRSALNPQARHGADLMSRVGFAVAEKGQKRLQDLIRNELGKLVLELTTAARIPPEEVQDAVIVGNTVMHHLFCGIDLDPLSHFPFELNEPGLREFTGQDLGWACPAARIRFLPCLGSFVGSDILAGILATKLHESRDLVALVDLGTNGEIALGNCEKIVCTSTAAGPAFEGARISMGMRASTGAISEVAIHEGGFQCRTLGGVAARGLCGSGLVDAAASGLDLGFIQPSGRFAGGRSELVLAEPVKLTQTDIRELQLAKGAIAAGIRVLLGEWGKTSEELSKIYLAGAFGNYINRASARRIGLINFPREKVHAAGNTALLGAKIALFSGQSETGSYESLRSKVRHVSLNEAADFQDIYVDEMGFPKEALLC